MSAEATPELAAKAAERHVIVIGGGIAGLVAAWECVKVGMPVTLLEAGQSLGGAIRRAEIDGVVIDAGAESFATRGGHVRALVDELGLTDRVVTPEPGGAWLAGIPGTGAAPLPAGGILGIPDNPFRDDVRRIIGWSGAWRAYIDRVRPPLTIGHEASLGRLVASRMGKKVRDRLVAPVTAGVYSAHPDDIDTDAAAPGLNAALTRVGSLAGAVDVLRQERSANARATPGAAVEGLTGGMSTLVDALVDRLRERGAVLRTAAPVLTLERDADGWVVTVPGVAPGADGPVAAGPGAAGPGAQTPGLETPGDETPGDDALAAVAEETLRADAVIVATPESVARRLLAAHVPDLGDEGEAPEIEIVSLLLEAPALDAAPRGSGVLTVPGSHRAKALTHATAKWGWLREAAAGRHVVRVSFGAQGEGAATATLDDDEAAQLALSEASALLGVPLAPTALIAAHRSRFTQSQPASLRGAAERRTAARAAVASVDALAVAGAWIAGTGLAQVVPDAKAEADRLRRALIWD